MEKADRSSVGLPCIYAERPEQGDGSCAHQLIMRCAEPNHVAECRWAMNVPAAGVRGPAAAVRPVGV